jgi:hypothetical protein
MPAHDACALNLEWPWADLRFKSVRFRLTVIGRLILTFLQSRQARCAPLKWALVGSARCQKHHSTPTDGEIPGTENKLLSRGRSSALLNQVALLHQVVAPRRHLGLRRSESF